MESYQLVCLCLQQFVPYNHFTDCLEHTLLKFCCLFFVGIIIEERTEVVYLKLTLFLFCFVFKMYNVVLVILFFCTIQLKENGLFVGMRVQREYSRNMKQHPKQSKKGYSCKWERLHSCLGGKDFVSFFVSQNHMMTFSPLSS